MLGCARASPVTHNYQSQKNTKEGNWWNVKR
ncbi:Uncharacterised protein [Burkholderia pseudomallei]|nr:Uncharacterised protein [Burkholderia pseudomallei]CAJ7298231.1 Uncharacterised protein [Burkholderia pseudomallei]